MPAITFTADSATDQLTMVAHGLNTGDGPAATRNVGGALPTGLAAVTDYWIIRVDADHVKLATSSTLALAGTAIDITANGSGTQSLEIGIPYRRARTYVALSQLKSADLDAIQDALTATYDLLTGQAQSIWTAIVVALNVTFNALVTFAAGATAAAGQHFTVSGTGKFKHGTKTIQIPFTAPGVSAAPTSVAFSAGGGGVYVAPIGLPLGARILKVRAMATDSATGPTKFVIGLRQNDTLGNSTLTNAGSQSAGSGAFQTVESSAMTVTVASGIRYWAEAQIQTGAAACAMQGFEVDYDQP